MPTVSTTNRSLGGSNGHVITMVTYLASSGRFDREAPKSEHLDRHLTQLESAK